MGGGNGLAILKHPRRAGARGAAKVMDEVHDVRTKHPEIFTTTAPVALAARANFQQLAELAFRDELVDD